MSALCQTRRIDDVRDESSSPPITAKLMRCGERHEASQPDGVRSAALLVRPKARAVDDSGSLVITGSPPSLRHLEQFSELFFRQRRLQQLEGYCVRHDGIEAGDPIGIEHLLLVEFSHAFLRDVFWGARVLTEIP
jgi:hypothetical protein